jgi:hypothetical protein
MAEDGLDTIGDGDRWRWRWVSPWAVERFSPTTFKTEKSALAAGRKWLREHT